LAKAATSTSPTDRTRPFTRPCDISRKSIAIRTPATVRGNSTMHLEIVHRHSVPFHRPGRKRSPQPSHEVGFDDRGLQRFRQSRGRPMGAFA
jgi:hypothetical protein